MHDLNTLLSEQLGIKKHQVDVVLELLQDGATIPFIARYRKEKTGGLDDGQLRSLNEKYEYLSDVLKRQESIITTIEEQGKLTPELKELIENTLIKSRLEEIYAPYKSARKTKGQIAVEQGLEPLADNLLANPEKDPELEAALFINDDVADNTAALNGARAILMERFSQNFILRQKLRDELFERGIIESRVISGKEQEGAKFQDYFEYDELLKDIASHRALALFRGRHEGILSVKLVEPEKEDKSSICESMIAQECAIEHKNRAADDWLAQVVRFTWKVKFLLSIESELFGELRERSEGDAIRVFAENLRDVLMAAPAGRKAVIGLDPGFRTGVKLAIVDDTGKLRKTHTLYCHQPQNKWDQSIETLAKYAFEYDIDLIAIGNGTASRETENLVKECKSRYPELKAQGVVVSEAGASVYSASEYASMELPDIDVSLRGAVSIARRLQDPLAELVKIDAKSIGVGQYQHDVNQSALAKSLDAVVEDCVNSVGVNLNTASSALLAHVSGIHKSLAERIIAYRNENGAFNSRQQLNKVQGLGAKAFEQAAGFLRIFGGDDALDQSAVHPEAYEVVRDMAIKLNIPLKEMVHNHDIKSKINANDYVNEDFGIETITDIIQELMKPGRDPRPQFKTATFAEGINKVSDVKEGMKLEGVVTNVTDFGAFVDVGVHQDGLVHISQLADQFVTDPRSVVRAGDIVDVTVLEVDVARNRISLSMKKNPDVQKAQKPRDAQAKNGNIKQHKQNKRLNEASKRPNNTMSNAFDALKKK